MRALPVITQSLSGWLLSPWIHMAGQLKNTKMVNWEDKAILWTPCINISPNPPANIYSSPVTPHPPGQVITTLLGLHKDDGFVLFLSHDLLHQLNKSDDGGKEATTRQDNNRFCYNIAAINSESNKSFLTSRPFPFPSRRQQFAECCGWHWAPEHQH